MQLSETQTKVLKKMQFGKWYSAYDLQCSMATLRALRSKKMVQARGHDQPGAFSMERTAIEWSLDKE